MDSNEARGLVLVVGASGKLGSACVRLLLDEGFRVRAMTRTPGDSRPLLDPGAEVVGGDLTRPETLANACRDVRFVIAAAHAALDRGANCPRNVDGQGHRDLIDAAIAAGVERLAYAGAAGGGPDHPVDFFRIKSETEGYLRASDLPFVIVQGPAFMETQHGIIGDSIRDKGQAFLFGRGEGRTTYVSVEDMARYLVWGLTDSRLQNRTVVVGGPEALSQNEVVAVYEKVLGRTARRRYLPVWVMKVARIVVGPFHAVVRRIMTMGEVIATTDTSFDATPLHAEFDWVPRSYEESVREWAAREE